MLGIKRQLADCEKFAALRGWPIADRYCDDDVSAYAGKPRPEYRRMLDDIAARRVDAVLVWHQDRLHRHPKELEEFFETCDRAGLKYLASVQGDVDLSTHDGRFHARIMGAVARKESDDKSRRATRKHLELAERGKPAGGLRPYGYSQDREVIPEEAAIMREATRRLLAGETLMAVATDLNRRGVPTARGAKWSCHVLKHIVINPSNAGHRTLKGRIVGQAVWEAILTEEESQRVRSLLTDPARRLNRSARRYLLSSLLRCANCGAKLGARPNHTRPAYACIAGPASRNCGRITILAEPVETFISDAVLYRLDTPDLARALSRRPDRSRELDDLERQIANDKAQQEELAVWWADKQIDGPEYLVARKRIADRLEASQARYRQIDTNKSLRALIDQAADLRRRWADLNLHQKRAVITALLDHVVVSPATTRTKYVDVGRLKPVWRV
jgi:DNA invertase Pin-like site-specific DNA recombinase